MTTVQWFGHACFSLTNANGAVALIDPWFGNPKAPAGALDALTRVDVVFITHGHADHIGDVAAIAKKFASAKIFVIHELTFALKKMGVAEAALVGMNKGGVVHEAGFTAVMVNAAHSSGCSVDGVADQCCVSGGEAAGFVVKTADLCLYHTGDTDVLADMQIVDDLHAPDVVLACVGGHYTMGPLGVAYALHKYMPGVKRVIPMHFGTFPLLAGTPTMLRKELREGKWATGERVQVIELAPGDTWQKK